MKNLLNLISENIRKIYHLIKFPNGVIFISHPFFIQNICSFINEKLKTIKQC